ncbi:MAG: mechanosensitive ion channel [Bacteroidales bacterium]|nr:mechanosensitive ion channel [Bacteroidales bacterium]
MFILQTNNPVPSEEIVSEIDSTKIAAGDFAEALASDPSQALHQLGVEAIHFGLKLLLAIIIYIVGIWLISLIKRAMNKAFEHKKTDKTVSSFVSSFTSVVLTVLLIVLAISTLGINTTSLAALLAGGGVAIGMALSGTLQNFSGGLLILAFKPFKVGDFIEAQGYAGTVTEMSIISTRLTLPDNRSVTIPHGPLANGNINNYSRNPYRRLEWKVSMDYGVDSDACMAKLLEVVKANPKVLDSSTAGAQDPFAAVFALSDSAVQFVLRAWVRNPDYWEVYFAVNDAIYTQLPAAGFTFPFPQMDIHVKT